MVALSQAFQTDLVWLLHCKWGGGEINRGEKKTTYEKCSLFI